MQDDQLRVKIHGNFSECHCGSAAVWTRLRQLVEERSDLQLIDADGDYDCLIINGEGTMHDNSKRAIRILKKAKAAKRSGRRVYLLNSVWQNMTRRIDIVKKLDGVCVRESVSFSNIKALCPTAKIATDLSYDLPIKISGKRGQLFQESGNPTEVMGGFHLKHGVKFERGKYTHLSIEDHDKWEDYLNSLSGASLVVTGLHHEFMACCKLRIPFVAYRGNTDKVLGVIQRAGADIPVASTGSELAYNIKNLPPVEQYKKLFDFLENQKPFALEDLGI